MRKCFASQFRSTEIARRSRGATRLQVLLVAEKSAHRPNSSFPLNSAIKMLTHIALIDEWTAKRVHTDVLKLARTAEDKELIVWGYARWVFFGSSQFDRRLALARHCQHDDARHLLSLFPRDPPATAEEAAKVFLARTDDALLVLGCDVQGSASRRAAEALSRGRVRVGPGALLPPYGKRRF